MPGGPYIYRPGTAPPVFRNNKVGQTYLVWSILGKYQENWVVLHCLVESSQLYVFSTHF